MASIRCNCLYRKMLHLRTLYLPLHIFQKMVAVPVPVFFINKIVISIQIELIHPKYHRNVFRLPLFFIGIAIAHAELRVPLLSQSRYARILSEAGIPAVTIAVVLAWVIHMLFDLLWKAAAALSGR